MITVRELKDMIQGMGDETVVLITRDQEWNDVREAIEVDRDFFWDKESNDYQHLDEMVENRLDFERFVNCIIIS